MTLHRWPLLAVFVVTSIVAVACAGGKPIDVGDDDDDAATTPSIDTTFASGVLPALTSEGCGNAGCHAAPATGAGNLALSGTPAEIYAEVTTPNDNNSGLVINTANAAASLILTKGAGTAHGGGTLWADADATYQSVLGWIEAGAQNN